MLNRERARRKVHIGAQYARWREVGIKHKLRRNDEIAKLLLDVYYAVAAHDNSVAPTDSAARKTGPPKGSLVPYQNGSSSLTAKQISYTERLNRTHNATRESSDAPAVSVRENGPPKASSVPHQNGSCSLTSKQISFTERGNRALWKCQQQAAVSDEINVVGMDEQTTCDNSAPGDAPVPDHQSEEQSFDLGEVSTKKDPDVSLPEKSLPGDLGDQECCLEMECEDIDSKEDTSSPLTPIRAPSTATDHTGSANASASLCQKRGAELAPFDPVSESQHGGDKPHKCQGCDSVKINPVDSDQQVMCNCKESTSVDVSDNRPEERSFGYGGADMTEVNITCAPTMDDVDAKPGRMPGFTSTSSLASAHCVVSSFAAEVFTKSENDETKVRAELMSVKKEVIEEDFKQENVQDFNEENEGDSGQESLEDSRQECVADSSFDQDVKDPAVKETNLAGEQNIRGNVYQTDVDTVQPLTVMQNSAGSTQTESAVLQLEQEYVSSGAPTELSQQASVVNPVSLASAQMPQQAHTVSHMLSQRDRPDQVPTEVVKNAPDVFDCVAARDIITRVPSESVDSFGTESAFNRKAEGTLGTERVKIALRQKLAVGGFNSRVQASRVPTRSGSSPSSRRIANQSSTILILQAVTAPKPPGTQGLAQAATQLSVILPAATASQPSCTQIPAQAITQPSFILPAVTTTQTPVSPGPAQATTLQLSASECLVPSTTQSDTNKRKREEEPGTTERHCNDKKEETTCVQCGKERSLPDHGQYFGKWWCRESSHLTYLQWLQENRYEKAAKKAGK